MSRGAGRRRAAVAMAVALALGAAGCGAEEPHGEISLPGDSPGTSGSPSPSPSDPASAEQAAIPSSYTDAQLTFTLPSVSGARAAALRTVVSFEHGMQLTFRNARVSPLVKKYGNPDAQAFAQRNADYMSKHHIHFTGPTRISVEQVRTSDHVAIVDTCIDGTGNAQVIDGKPQPLDPPLRAAVRFVVNRTDAGWKVVERDGQGGKSC